MIGKKLPHHRIGEKLGRGGMGMVCKGFSRHEEIEFLRVVGEPPTPNDLTGRKNLLTKTRGHYGTALHPRHFHAK